MASKARAYNCWTPEEEECLRNGVIKHGLGSWEIIRRDPDFGMLERRSGVQLKDKWRNLVKFRHISVEESRSLKPKTSGPWSRKHSACGQQLHHGRSGSQPLSDSRRSSRSGPEDEEHAAMLLALEGAAASSHQGLQPIMTFHQGGNTADDIKFSDAGIKRHSQRQASKSRVLEDYETTLSEPAEGDFVHEEQRGEETRDTNRSREDLEPEVKPERRGDEEGGVVGQSLEESAADESNGKFLDEGSQLYQQNKRRKRRLCEDRRFGIYDQRRYGPGGELLDSGGRGGARGRSWGRRARSERVDSEDEDTEISEEEDMVVEEDDDDDEEDEMEGRRRRSTSRSKSSYGRGRGRGRGRGGSRGDDYQDNEILGGGYNPLLVAESGFGAGLFIVSCCCGTTFNDGAPMIGCENCSVCSHVACLQQQMQADPLRYKYDFQHYKCEACQLESLMLGGIPASMFPSSTMMLGAVDRRQAALDLAWQQSYATSAPGKSSSRVGGEAEAASGSSRPRRERKASSRYRSDGFAPLEELEEGLGVIARVEEEAEAAAAAAASGRQRGVSTAPQQAGSDGSQHSSRSSRDKTNEASTLLLGLAKQQNGKALDAQGEDVSTGGAFVGWGGNDQVLRPPSRNGLMRGSSGARGSKGGSGRRSRGSGMMEDMEADQLQGDQLELFLAQGSASGMAGTRISSGSSSRDLMLLASRGGYPARTASPATAALAAAAAIAMKEHEAEMMMRAGRAGGGAGGSGSIASPSAVLDPLAALYPDTGLADALGQGRSQGRSQQQQQPSHVAPLPRKASQGSLRISGTSPRGGSFLPPINNPSTTTSSGGFSQRPQPIVGVHGPSNSNGLDSVPTANQHHHQQLLASLGIDGRQSPLFNNGGAVGEFRRPGGIAASPGLLYQHPHLSRMAALQSGFSPRGLLPSGLQNPFGESDDEGSQGLLDSLRCDPSLIGLLGGSNGTFSRAATPASQLFLDSLMRATPDFLAQHFQMQQQQYTTTGNSGGGATAPSATAPAPLATSPPAAGIVAAVSTQGPTGSLSVAGPVHPESSLQVEPGREVPQVVRSSAFQSVIEQARAASQAALAFNSTSEAAPTGAAAGPGSAPDPCSSQAADLGLDPQASHQQELARLVAAAGRDSGLLPSSSSQDMQLLRDFLRPGTPEAAWALLRGATPTPLLAALGTSSSTDMLAALGTSSSTDMLAALGSSSSGGDPLMAAAAASWLMTGRYTPLSSQHQLLVSALSDSAPAGSGTTAAVAAVQPGVTEVQSAVHVAPDKGDGGNTLCSPYVSNGCSVLMTSPQQSPAARPSPLPRPVAAPAGTMLRPVAAPAGTMLPLHVLEQTALQVRPGNEDFTGGDIPFSVDILLRASTPVAHQ